MSICCYHDEVAVPIATGLTIGHSSMPLWFEEIWMYLRKIWRTLWRDNVYPKASLCYCAQPVDLVTRNTLGEENCWFFVIPHIQGVTESIEKLWSSHNAKLLNSLSRRSVINDWDHEYLSDRPNVSLAHVWRSTQRKFFFARRKTLRWRSMLANITTQLRGGNSRNITINQRNHQHGCLEAWHIIATYAPFNSDDGGILPHIYLHLVKRKGRKLPFLS